MKVAELFVQLGVKGGDEAAKSLNTVKDTMADVASKSLLAIAGISGAVYAFKGITAQSNEAGSELIKFNNYTGIAIDYLQRMQYAFRQANVPIEETQANIENVTKALAAGVLSGTNPSGLGALVSKVNFDPNRRLDTAYVISKVIEYIKSVDRDNSPATRALVNQIVGGLGLSRGFVQGARSYDINRLFNIAPVTQRYTNPEARQLSEMNVAWSNLLDKVEHIIGRLNIRFGPQLLKDLTEILPKIDKLVTAFASLADKIHLVSAVGKIFEGWGMIFEEGSKFVDALKDTSGIKNLGKNIIKDTLNEDRGLYETVSAPVKQPIQYVTSEFNINVELSETESHNASAIGAAVAAHVGELVNNAHRQIPQGGH